MIPFTKHCTKFCSFVLRPVPGAVAWPRRLECSIHGYPVEANRSEFSNEPEKDTPNDYVTEVASPADLVIVGDAVVATY